MKLCNNVSRYIRRLERNVKFLYCWYDNSLINDVFFLAIATLVSHVSLFKIQKFGCCVWMILVDLTVIDVLCASISHVFLECLNTYSSYFTHIDGNHYYVIQIYIKHFFFLAIVALFEHFSVFGNCRVSTFVIQQLPCPLTIFNKLDSYDT